MIAATCCYCGATDGIDQDAYGVWGCTDNNAERCRRRCADLDAEEAQVGEHTLEDQLAESMADAAAGNPGKPWEQMRAEVALERARAEYAALAAGLDAVVAEAERLLDEERALQYGDDWAQLETSRDEWQRRADAAEAQLAEQDRLIHDGIYALMGERHAALTRAAAVWEERALAAEAQLAQAREDGARSAFALVQANGTIEPGDVVELFAAWRAAQTEAAG